MDSSDVDEEGKLWRIDKWFPKLSPDIRSSLRLFHKELIFFNSKINLISPRTEHNADLVHIADGILGSQAVFDRTRATEIYDIGSGSGVPGIIIALMKPTVKVILVDSDPKKIEFLKHCVSKIGLDNCSALYARLEDIPNASISCAVARGLASISKSLLLARKPAKLNSEFFHFKGPAWSSEVAGIPSQIVALWDPIHACDYALPLGESVMSIVLTKRIKL